MVMKAALLTFVLSVIATPILSTALPTLYPQTPLVVPREKERYDGHQVWRIDWTGLEEGIKFDIMAAAELLSLDIWRSTPSAFDVHLNPHQFGIFKSFLPSRANINLFIPNLQDLVDASTSSTISSGSNDQDINTLEWNVSTLDTSFHDSYHTLEEIYSFGDALVEAFPGLVTTFDIGISGEGRVIRGWKAHCERNHTDAYQGFKRGKKTGKKGKGKQNDGVVNEPLEFVVQSGQHAREWVGPSSAIYFLHWLLVEKHTDRDGRIGELLDSFVFTIVPTINPDGYVYSHDHSRMWRKNRQDVGNPKCSGIDLNSNWGYKWRPAKASPCSDSYGGTRAFQAPEIRSMADYLANGTTLCSGCSHAEMKKHGDKKKREQKVRAFVDLHSYGQLFMYPFAHSCDDFPPDAEMLLEAGLGVAKVMGTHNDEGFEAGQACEMTYRAPGDAIDFTYGITDIRWSYSAELRDTGTYGFMLPPTLIRPAAEEVAAGMEFLAWFIFKAEVGGFD